MNARIVGVSKALLLLLAPALGPGGCALVPGEYPRVDQAHALHAEARSDAGIARLAPAELKRADEAVDRARVAREMLDDPAVVDHLAYLAKQRLAIAREAAELRLAQETLERSGKSRRRSIPM